MLPRFVALRDAIPDSIDLGRGRGGRVHLRASGRQLTDLPAEEQVNVGLVLADKTPVTVPRVVEEGAGMAQYLARLIPGENAASRQPTGRATDDLTLAVAYEGGFHLELQMRTLPPSQSTATVGENNRLPPASIGQMPPLPCTSRTDAICVPKLPFMLCASGGPLEAARFRRRGRAMPR